MLSEHILTPYGRAVGVAIGCSAGVFVGLSVVWCSRR